MPPTICVGACLAALLHAGPPTEYVGRANQLKVQIPRESKARPRTSRSTDRSTKPSWRRPRCCPASRSTRRRTAFPPRIRRRCCMWYIADGAVRRHSRVRAARRRARDARRSRQDLRRRQRAAAARHVPRPAAGVRLRGESVRRSDGRHDRRDGAEHAAAAGRRRSPAATAPDLSQDFVFASKGRLTEYGYEVEMRIPFKSLKYQSADVQSWDINVVREVQHSATRTAGRRRGARTRRSSRRAARSTASRASIAASCSTSIRS